MPYPKIKFQKNTKKDFNTLLAFVRDAKYDNGNNLEWAILKSNPQLKVYFNQKKHYKVLNEKKLFKFIEQAYNSKSIKMTMAMESHKKRWEKIASVFFFLTEKLFPGRKWPKGKYIAFGTIWDMYPRFLADKTFQIPFFYKKTNYINVIIAHELLHFIFYDYFFEHFPKYKKPKYDFFVWHVSEIFNALVQNSPAWLDHFKLKSTPYHEHEKIIKRLSFKLKNKKMWDTEVMINMIIKEVKI